MSAAEAGLVEHLPFRREPLASHWSVLNAPISTHSHALPEVHDFIADETLLVVQVLRRILKAFGKTSADIFKLFDRYFEIFFWDAYRCGRGCLSFHLALLPLFLLLPPAVYLRRGNSINRYLGGKTNDDTSMQFNVCITFEIKAHRSSSL